jgi:hypothetical protein
MNPQTVAALADKAALLSIGYAVFGLFVVVAAFTFLAVLGERALGLNLRKFIDNVEKQAARGNVWPGIACFVLIPSAVLCLVLFLGLR